MESSNPFYPRQAMTLQELRYVVALADAGHFGHAAEVCFVSQSTLSTQIKKLEDFLGIVLFDRSLKNVALTPIGHEIVDSARRIIEESTRICEISRQIKDPMARAIRLGVIPTLGPYYLPHALPLIHESFPNLRLLLREEMTPNLLIHLTEGKLDAGLLALPLPTDDPAMETIELFTEPFLAAVPADHPLAAAEEVHIDELVDAGLFLLEEGHCLRNQALEACGLERLENEEFRATSLETLRQMVSMGLGVTLIWLLPACNHMTLVPVSCCVRSLTLAHHAQSGWSGGDAHPSHPLWITWRSS